MSKGIVKRWAFHYLSISVVFMVLIVIGAAFSVRTYYYENARAHLTALGKNAAQQYSLALAHDTQREWLQSYIDEIDEKESLDAAICGHDGSILVSTSKITSNVDDSYIILKESDDNPGFRIDVGQSGEKMLIYTTALSKGGNAAFVCYLQQLDPVDKSVMQWILILTAAVILVLASFVVPTLMFMNTIVKPVRELRATAHRIAQGDLETRVENMYDDEIGELTDAINHMAEEIKTADSMKNDFISSVSHELRTPLTAIKGWAETMSIGEPDSMTMTKGLGIIINESERLTGMVEELLDFSRIQSGRMVLSMDKTDVLAELGEAVYMLRERAAKEKKHFVYEEPESLPPVLADRNRLRQVFINIIDNALKYTPVGGVIGIDVKCEDEKIKVVISDTGCGINEKDLPRIKEKFYKANKTVRGSGIGLAVADEIMALHKGSLEIESKEDVGTTVTITIPILDRDDEKIL